MAKPKRQQTRAGAKKKAKPAPKKTSGKAISQAKGDQPWLAAGVKKKKLKRRSKTAYSKKLNVDLDEILKFYRSAGIRAEFASPQLRINGYKTPRLEEFISPKHHATPQGLRQLLNAMTIRYAGARFTRALTENGQFSHSARAFLNRNANAFEIRVDGVLVARVAPTSATVPGDECTIYGNFLKTGKHWNRLNTAVSAAMPTLLEARENVQLEPRRRPGRKPLPAPEPEGEDDLVEYRPPIQIDAFPDWLPRAVADASIEASRRIRTERQVAFDRPIVLSSRLGTLRLHPVAGRPGSLRVPFDLTSNSTVVSASLRLGESDPLALSVRDDVPERDAVRAWVQALLGFAEATCTDPLEGRAATANSHRPGTGLRSAHGSGGHSTRQPAHRSDTWSPRLVPVGAWTYRGSFVAGHRRVLRPGHAPSKTAIENAKRAGIQLRKFETWVQSHSRGIPDGMELTFEWDAPAGMALTSSINTESMFE